MRQLLRGFAAAFFLFAANAALSYAWPFTLDKAGTVERDVVYKTVGDYSLKMDIHRPPSADELLPAVVYVHGGGWYSGDKTAGAGQQDIPELLSRGYVVAAVNYRLAPKYKFPAQIEDVRCAVRFLRENAVRYGIDAARIGVWGDSAGGHLAALLGTAGASDEEEADRVQAVASIYGPTNLAEICERDKSPHMEHVFGTADGTAPAINLASPLTHVSGDDPPFLLVHGEADEVVPVYHSLAFYERLVSAGVPTELVIVENCGHCFISSGEPVCPTRTQITHILADFFDRYLKYA